MNNKIPYTVIDTAGQTTAVISVTIPREKQPEVAKPLMTIIKNIGQVCFIKKSGRKNIYRLQMMGNELSVNGTMAGAFYLLNKLKRNKIRFETSGLKTLVEAKVKNSSVLIRFSKTMVKSINKNVVSLRGMNYLLWPGIKRKRTTKQQKETLLKLARNYPASGIVFYERNKIQPLIYVKATNTFVWETSCGSGSIAYALVSGRSKILQPSGSTATIKQTEKSFEYKTKAVILPMKGGEKYGTGT